MTLITDIVKYFAKFPAKAGVLKNFEVTLGDADYEALRAYCTALPNALLPEIKHFIFGTDEAALEAILKNIDSYFMLVLYEVIRSTAPDATRNRKTSQRWSIIIGHPSNTKDTDPVQEIQIMDKCLSLIQSLIALIQHDDAETCGNLRFFDSEINIVPLPKWMLYNCHAWELSFQKTNNLLI